MDDAALYDYHLPRELIAQEPLATRSDARLLVVDRRSGRLSHHNVRDLPCLLAPLDCLVLNDTRVVPARLVGHRKATRGHWEGLFLSADERGFWQLLSKSRGKLAAGETIVLHDRRARDDMALRLVQKQPGGVWIAVPESSEPAVDTLDRVGRVPLPRYIRRGKMIREDVERYQTVYARHPGAVAAPTAGLHLTNELLGEILEHGVTPVRVTLHVGLDTFRPIKASRLADHAMHSEWGCLDAGAAATIQRCRQAGGKVVAVGTTSVRVLETAAEKGAVAPWTGQTRLFIRPPYAFRAVDALLTNFHLPRTALLVLVCALAGRSLVLSAYEEAIRERYRFYSYGDAMLIL